MKKIICIVIGVLAAAGAAAQDNWSFKFFGADRGEIRNDYSFWRGYDKHHYDGKIGLVEIGFNGLREGPMAYTRYPDAEKGFMELDMARSLHLTINVATFSVAFNSARTLGMTMGLGMTINDYALQTPVRFAKADGWIKPVNTGENLKKAKLNTFAIHIPLVFEVNPTHDFFFSVGCFADLVMSSHLKSKFPKEKVKGAYTNFGQFGVTARVGYGDAYFFANYGFADLINYKHGPELRPYSFGIGLGF